MQTTDIEHEIRSFLVSNFLSGRNDKLNNDEPLLGNVVDSSGVVELVIFLQERFEITVEDDEVTTENLGSIKNATAFVQGKLADKTSN
jgi:acyl carrier protein